MVDLANEDFVWRNDDGLDIDEDDDSFMSLILRICDIMGGGEGGEVVWVFFGGGVTMDE